MLSKEDFLQLLFSRNNSQLNVIDISIQKCQNDIIKYLYVYLEKNDQAKYLGYNYDSMNHANYINNVFHHASKRSNIFPIIFFFEKLSPIYKNLYTNVLNIPNNFQITPLHYACYFGKKIIIDVLLDLEADINQQDSDGNTPLHYAINSSCTRTIRKLLIRGANKSIKRKDGMIPLNLAKEDNKLDLVEILMDKPWYSYYSCNQSTFQESIDSYSRKDIFLIATIIIYFCFNFLFGVLFLKTLSNSDDITTFFVCFDSIYIYL